MRQENKTRQKAYKLKRDWVAYEARKDVSNRWAIKCFGDKK